eukprot:TRINITY_DN4136_c0_g1_i1.p2 TRINITY_DN4136_c0_g1~~TRINITY_DN4136_c0_g1_i1.p2  ORF type:complete len:168 (+),score=44.17 TRINITY_DN4136_c0_g1_i1:52-555(+)
MPRWRHSVRLWCALALLHPLLLARRIERAKLEQREGREALQDEEIGLSSLSNIVRAPATAFADKAAFYSVTEEIEAERVLRQHALSAEQQQRARAHRAARAQAAAEAAARHARPSVAELEASNFDDDMPYSDTAELEAERVLREHAELERRARSSRQVLDRRRPKPA